MLTILHVSDVHFGTADHLGAQPLITEALIKAVHSSNIEPNICIFTGDLAFDGSLDQLETGRFWLQRLIRPEWKTDLFVIPGNHDVARKLTAPHLFRSIAANENSYNDWRKDGFSSCKHLASFFEWHEVASTVLPLRAVWTTPFGFHHSCTPQSSMPLHVIGLNSAIFCCNDSDAGQLVVDTKTLTAALDKSTRNGGLIVAASHHPLSELIDWNKGHIERFLSQESGTHLFLHGHLHEQLGTSKSDSTGRRLTTLAAGAAYQDSPWPYAFSFYFIDFEGHAVHTQTYSYSPNSGAWTQDTKNSRKIMVDLPASPAKIFQSTSQTHNQKRSAATSKQMSTEIATRRDANRTAGSTSDEACWRFREAAREVQARLLPLLQESEIVEQSYALKYRVKDFDSIVRKLTSNLVEDCAYELHQMPDICGFRIITLYQDRIPEIIAYILDAIVSGRSNTNFIKTRPVKIDINTSRAENDPLSITPKVKAVANASAAKPVVSVRHRPTGYSSVHLVASVGVPSGSHRLNEMLIEIQVRSALEDVWGEIDHKLRYGSSRGDVGISWTHHLNIFKSLIDTLVQYVDVIKTHSEQDSPHPPPDVKHIRPVASPKAEMERLKDLPSNIRARLSEAYDKWIQADATLDKGGDVGLFRIAADAFSALLPDDIELSGNEELKGNLLYTVKAESAYLLMYTGDVGDLRRSEEIYRDILSSRPKDATAQFRIGAVYRRLGEYSRAEKHLSSAIDILDRGEDNRIDKSHWVYDDARRNLALTRWYVFRDTSLAFEIRRDALISAVRVCHEILLSPAERQPRHRASVVNDYLYYVWDATQAGVELSSEIASQTEIEKLAKELYEYIVSTDQTIYHYLDTILRYIGGDCQRAVSIALREEIVLEKFALSKNPSLKLPERGTTPWIVSISRYLDEERADSLAYCEGVLGRCGRGSIQIQS